MIDLNGQIYENYGSADKPIWEVPFDCGEPPYFQLSTQCCDKNNKEIFEGDILKLPDEMRHTKNIHNLLGHVWLYEGGFIISFNHQFSECGEPLIYFSCRGCEVIGNTFENPELMP